jgi:branched-chain amino acid transport system ATP-binding protein
MYQKGGTLSGGEQQMLAIGRALMQQPSVLLLDEPSMGLAPLLVEEIFRIVKRLNADHGTTILLVEQNAQAALQVANRAYVLETGKIAMSGVSQDLLHDPRVMESYLGF